MNQPQQLNEDILRSLENGFINPQQAILALQSIHYLSKSNQERDQQHQLLMALQQAQAKSQLAQGMPKERQLFQCRTCLRTFSRSDHLEKHERTHSAYKAYSCLTCARRFHKHEEKKQHQEKCQHKVEEQQQQQGAGHQQLNLMSGGAQVDINNSSRKMNQQQQQLQNELSQNIMNPSTTYLKFQAHEALRQEQAQVKALFAQVQAQNETPMLTQEQATAQASAPTQEQIKALRPAEVQFLARLVQTHTQQQPPSQQHKQQLEQVTRSLAKGAITPQQALQAFVSMGEQFRKTEETPIEVQIDMLIQYLAQNPVQAKAVQDLLSLGTKKNETEPEKELDEYEEDEEESEDNEEMESFDEDYDDEIRELRFNLEHVIADFHDYKKETSKEIQELKDLINQIPRGEVQKVNDELQKEHEVKNSEFEVQKSELKDSFEKVKSLEEKLVALEKELYKERAKKNEAINELNYLEKKLEVADLKIQDLEKELQKERSEKLVHNNDELPMTQLNALMLHAKLQHFESDKNKNATIERMQQEINSSVKEQKEKDPEIQEKDQKIKQLKMEHTKKIDQLNDDYLFLKEDLIAKNDVIKRLEQQINNFEKNEKSKQLDECGELSL